MGENDLYVVLPLGEHWESYVRFEPQDGHPVVAELHIRPCTDEPAKQLPGQLPSRPVTPAGGLTSRALRDVHLGEAIAIAYRTLGIWIERGRPARTGLLTNFSEQSVKVPRRPGRKGRDDSFYLPVAAAYVDAVQRGSRTPVVDAARDLSGAHKCTYEATYVRDLLNEARRRGLLTRPPKGRAGGQLTDKARAIQQREDRP